MCELGEVSAEMLRAEADALPADKFPLATRLLFQEIEKMQSGKSWREDRKMIDVTKERCVRLSCRVYVPSKEHPKFNFVGKLLGPKGNSLKRLQEETMTKMAILGRGSMRDKQKEQTLRSAGDPKFSHLADDLHVEVTSFAPPAEAHARMAYALSEIRRFLVPDYNDDIRQEQMREMQKLIVDSDKEGSTSAESPPLSSVGAKLVTPMLLASGVPNLLGSSACHPALRGIAGLKQPSPSQTGGAAQTTTAPSINQTQEDSFSLGQLAGGYMGATAMVPEQLQLMDQLLAAGNGVQLPALQQTSHLTSGDGLDYSAVGGGLTAVSLSDLYSTVLSQTYPALYQSSLGQGDTTLKMASAQKMAPRYEPYYRGANGVLPGS